jgi:hypothetical protein
MLVKLAGYEWSLPKKKKIQEVNLVTYYEWKKRERDQYVFVKESDSVREGEGEGEGEGK